MKKLIVPFLTLFLFSCAPNIYFTVLDSNDNKITQTENKQFVSENETVKVTYDYGRFSDYTTVVVENKTDQPLYLNWANSSLIVGELGFSYMGNIALSSDRDKADWYAANKNLSYIPPKQTIIMASKLMHRLCEDDLFEKFAETGDLQVQKKYIVEEDKVIGTEKVVKASYTEKNSPLVFSNFLTFFQDIDKPFVLNNTFYVKNIIRAKSFKKWDLDNEYVGYRNVFFFIPNVGKKAFTSK